MSPRSTRRSPRRRCLALLCLRAQDAAYVLARTTNVHGFYGASSAERLPVEVAITEQMRKFKAVPMKG